MSIAVRMNTEARKQEIVRAALETIAEHGVQGATVSRIAKGAGITSAALYSHFENRQAILLAALDVVYEQVFDSFRASTSADPVERIRQIFENHAEKVRNQDPTSHAHLFLEFVASAPEEGLRDAIRDKEFATASYLASIVEELGSGAGCPRMSTRSSSRGSSPAGPGRETSPAPWGSTASGTSGCRPG